MVRQTLFEQFQEETYTRGFEVITSIDEGKQLAANRALVNGLKTIMTNPMAIAGPMPTIRPPPEIRHLNGWSIWRRCRLMEINSRPLSQVYGKGPSPHCLRTARKSMCPGTAFAGPLRFEAGKRPPPQVAGDAVQVGDLIRVKPAPDHWELGQVPDIRGALVSVSPITAGFWLWQVAMISAGIR